MQQDPVADARDLVRELFPHARWAVLTGSVTTRHRTAGSDLDIVVRLPEGDPQAPHRDSRRWRGWPVELFVHDRRSLEHYLAKDLPGRRPVLRRMIATGVPLTEPRDPECAELRDLCAKELRAGPPPLTEVEAATARYGLTDVLDDLAHVTDAGEAVAIAGHLWAFAATAALDLGGHWRGGGKWLLRELRDADPELAERWVAAYGDAERTAAFAREVLDRAGGPLFEGHRLAGERA